MGGSFYGETPAEDVDFQKEARKELAELYVNAAEIKKKLDEAAPEAYAYQYWAIKMHHANERLKVGTITLD